MGLFSKRKRCPICQAQNEVALDAAAGVSGDVGLFMPFLRAVCKRCEYEFSFNWLSLLLGAGWLLPMVLYVLSKPTAYCAVCGVFIIIYIAIGLIGFLTIVHTRLFDRLLDRLIVRKAKKMVRNGKTESWTGSFWNAEMRGRVKQWLR